MTQIYNLARGHALSQARTSITMEDIPMVIHAVLSTATIERVRLLDLLIEHKGILTTSLICESLLTSPPTARRTMTELKASKLVDEITGPDYNAEMKIQLKSKFAWFLTDEFAKLKGRALKEIYPPRTHEEKQSGIFSSDNIQEEERDSSPVRNEPMRGGTFSFNPPNRDVKEEPTKPPPRSYSDFLVDGVPKWQIENRGMTEEESQAFIQETERLKNETTTYT